MDPSIEPDHDLRFTREETERIHKIADELDQQERLKFGVRESSDIIDAKYVPGHSICRWAKKANKEEIRLWISLWQVRMESALRNG